MLALEGKRVLDLAQFGAFCTMLLGDLGAEVIKIEAPPEVGGRGAGLAMSAKSKEARRGTAFDALNRNKKSIAINLRSEAGRKILYRLAEEADVVVEGFRPGVVKRLKIDYGTIRAINPRIVYCSLSGYGQSGPYKDLPGHDITYISMAGALGMIGDSSDSPPVIPLNILADYAGAALHGVVGILAALLSRENTGEGQYIDISFMDTVISVITWFTCGYFSGGNLFPRGETLLHGAYPYYGTYEAKDGKYLSIACIEPWFWQNLCRVLDKDEYVSYCYSPEHSLNKPEGDKWKQIKSSLQRIFLGKTRDEWFELLAREDVPVGKVYTLDEVFQDPHVLHRQMLVESEHPAVGKVRQAGIAIKLSDTPGRVRSLAPLLGEHTDEILMSLGYGKSQIDEMRRDSTVV